MKFNTITSVVLTSAIALSSAPVLAEQFWSDFSITGLRGDDYLNPFSGEEDSRNVVTIEHASGHSWGSTFLFVDRLSNPSDTYGELSLNPTIYKPDGFIKEVYLASTAEFGSGQSNQNNFLYGVGVSLAVPHFKYFKVSLFRRDQDDLGIGREDNNQITVVWAIDKGNLRYDGFLDIIDSADTNFGETEEGFNFTSQLKYNIGPAIGLKSGRLDVGIEYVYWKNKFGVDGQTEKNPNLLVKWHF